MDGEKTLDTHLNFYYNITGAIKKIFMNLVTQRKYHKWLSVCATFIIQRWIVTRLFLKASVTH